MVGRFVRAENDVVSLMLRFAPGIVIRGAGAFSPERLIPVCHRTCHSEERSDEESGWGKAWIYQPPPRSLAEPALSGVEGLGMTPLLYDGRQTGMSGGGWRR
jgi:hypothetical protein